ncbi:MAG: endo-1,4-beta-xylanase [Planctomycetota bacterium]
MLRTAFPSLCLTLAVASLAPAQQWRDDAHARIDMHRKSDFTVRVVDTAGSLVPDAQVRVEMQEHAFRFGTAVSARQLTDNTPDGSLYRQKLLENFNEVVFENDLKWPPTIGLWGNTNFSPAITNNALDWLEANALPARGHYLSWATWSGTDAWGNAPYSSGQGPLTASQSQLLRTDLFDRITDIATTIGDRVYEWDVINHPVGWLNDTYEDAGRLGPGIYSDIVDHASTVVPEGTDLWINEDNIIAGGSLANEYERVIQDLIDAGSPVDGIGFQAHFIEEWGRVSSSSPQQVYERIDRFDELVPRLRVTEFDIDVGSDEALQAQLMTDYLTAMFSHENIEAVTMWGFWAGRHWRGENGALYRQDWSEKPSLVAYQDLVFDEWWTDEAGTSDAGGLFDTRAFDGTYDVTVTFDGADYVVSGFSLTEDATLEVVVNSTTILCGDFNGDGTVDLLDLDLLGANFGRTDATFSQGDANGDGTVDLLDLDILGAEFSNTLPAAIPEPTTLVMLATLVLPTVGRSRQLANRGG